MEILQATESAGKIREDQGNAVNQNTFLLTQKTDFFFKKETLGGGTHDMRCLCKIPIFCSQFSKLIYVDCHKQQFSNHKVKLSMVY